MKRSHIVWASLRARMLKAEDPWAEIDAIPATVPRPASKPPTVPWLRKYGIQYLIEAEAKYGPKEQWHTIEDEELKRTLLAVMYEAYKDTRKIVRSSERRRRSSFESARREHKEFVSWVTASAADPTMFYRWPVPRTEKDAADLDAVAADASADGSETNPDTTANAARNATSESIPGHEDEVHNDGGESAGQTDRARQHGAPLAPYEELPFLRKRAAENPESLDDELRDWARRYLPADELEDEPSAPPQQQGSAPGQRRLHGDDTSTNDPWDVQNPEAVGGGGSRVESTSEQDAMETLLAANRKDISTRRGASMSLKQKLTAMSLTFDAEGVYFKLNEGGKRPQMVKAGPTPPQSGVVKIDWPTVRHAYGGRGFDQQRALERMARLCRGEDPRSI